VAFHRRDDPLWRLPAAGEIELRRDRRGAVATGTLACPRCDVPVALGGARVRPADALACPYCGHGGAVRDFLSLEAPSRLARVTVRIAERPRARAA
jgi:hypothetical protein